MAYNGHKNWNYWNVALWFGNDEGLYRMVRDIVRHSRSKADAAKTIQQTLQECNLTKTPDGANYSLRAIRAAIAGDSFA